jgi:O-antigen/teichoic acid export membrane protein
VIDAAVAKRLKQGLGANLFGQGVTAAVQLIGVPVLLHTWGVQLYGEWLLLFALPAYLATLDLGFSNSAANDMTARVRRGDICGALAVFQSSSLLVYVVTAVGAIASAAAVMSLPLDELLGLRAIDEETARWTVWVLTVQVLVCLINGAMHAGFRACGDYALHTGITNAIRLCQFTGLWIAALMGGGVLQAAITFCAIRVVGTAAAAWYLRVRCDWLRYGVGQASVDELKPLIKPAIANVSVPFAQAVNVQGITLLVGTTLGASAVVAFTALRTLTRLVLQLITSLSSAAEPEIAAAYGRQDLVLIKRIFTQTLRASVWLSIAGIGCLLVAGPVVVAIWTAGKIHIEFSLLIWLLAAAGANVLWSGAFSVLKAVNKHLVASGIFVGASLLALPGAHLLIQYTGDSSGAAMALLLVELAVAGYVYKAGCNFTGVDPWSAARAALDPASLFRSLRPVFVK